MLFARPLFVFDLFLCALTLRHRWRATISSFAPWFLRRSSIEVRMELAKRSRRRGKRDRQSKWWECHELQTVIAAAVHAGHYRCVNISGQVRLSQWVLRQFFTFVWMQKCEIIINMISIWNDAVWPSNAIVCPGNSCISPAVVASFFCLLNVSPFLPHQNATE